jgi:DNA-binding response OmpR family regulator
VKNVLIVDNDLGFVFWLGQALDAAGYDTLPAKGVAEAVALLAELKVEVDVLILRPALRGGEEFAADLRYNQNGQLKTIALTEEDEGRLASMSGWDGWQMKPRLPDANARKIFLSLVHEVLTTGTVLPSA